MLDLGTVRWMPVLLATVVHMVLGAAWFSVFANPWSRLAHPGKTKDDIGAGPKWIYGIAAIGGLVTAITLEVSMTAIGATDLASALTLAFVFWVGFVAVKYATTYAFEWRSWTLWAIDAGYPLASMLATAGVLALWP